MNSGLQEVSALCDGELESHEFDAVLKAIAHDGEEGELRTAWRDYGLIGDALRREQISGGDMTASVMTRVRAEPFLLVPPRRSPGTALTPPARPLFALAASLAGVAVVGWLAWSGGMQVNPGMDRIAVAAPPAPAFASARPASALTAESMRMPEGVLVVHGGDMSEYLLAHHQHASSFRLRDSTEHVRTVAQTERQSGR